MSPVAHKVLATAKTKETRNLSKAHKTRESP